MEQEKNTWFKGDIGNSTDETLISENTFFHSIFSKYLLEIWEKFEILMSTEKLPLTLFCYW